MGLSDKSVEEEGSHGDHGPTIPPLDLMNYSFDYVFVFSDTYFENCRYYLAGVCGVPYEKILPWRVLKNCEPVKYPEVFDFLNMYFEKNEVRNVLDTDISIADKYLLRAYSDITDVRLDGIGSLHFHMRQVYLTGYMIALGTFVGDMIVFIAYGDDFFQISLLLTITFKLEIVYRYIFYKRE